MAGTSSSIESKKRSMKIICDKVGTAEKTSVPLRVAIIGNHGSGKSAFVNSLAAALTNDYWREYAVSGRYDNAAAMTIYSMSYRKCGHDKNRAYEYKDFNLPTLIDIPGQMDDDNQKLEELYRLVFYGHIQEQSSFIEVFRFCNEKDLPTIRRKYATAYPEMKVDRVVFVASATQPLPEQLMKHVVNAARPANSTHVRRAIPIFGVLTNRDRVDVTSQSFKDKEETFRQILGLQKTRYKCVSNYCDQTDPEEKRTEQLNPDIDAPILKLFEQICEPGMRIVANEEKLPEPQSAGFTGWLKGWLS